MAEKRVTVLGAEYHIVDTDDLPPDRDGECRGFSKRILVRPLPEDADEDDRRAHKCLLRHECVHAFLAEAGMQRWDEDEDLVQFLAAKLPAMLGVMIRAGAM